MIDAGEHAVTYGAEWEYGVSADGNNTSYEWLQGAFKTADADYIYEEGQAYDWAVTLTPTKASATVMVEASIVDENGATVDTISKEVSVSRAPVETTLVSPADFPNLDDQLGDFTLSVDVIYNGNAIAWLTATFARTGAAGDAGNAGGADMSGLGAQWQYKSGNEWLSGEFNTAEEDFIFEGDKPYDWTVTLCPTLASATCDVTATIEDAAGNILTYSATVDVAKAPSKTVLVSYHNFPELTTSVTGKFKLTVTVNYLGSPLAQLVAVFGRISASGEGGGEVENHTGTWETAAKYNWLYGAFNSADSDLVFEGIQPYDWTFTLKQLKATVDVDIDATITDVNGNTVGYVYKTATCYKSDVPSEMLAAYEFPGLDELNGNFTLVCDVLYYGDVIARLTQTFSRTGYVACEHSWTDGYCDYCGVFRCDVEGHNLVQTTAPVDPTCETSGMTAVLTCSVCGYTEGGMEIPASHNMVETAAAVPATCVEPGKTAVLTCANGCGRATGGTEIPAHGHDWMAATTYAPKTCRNCGETEGDPISCDHYWIESWGDVFCDYCGMNHDCDTHGHYWYDNWDYYYCEDCGVDRCATEGHKWTLMEDSYYDIYHYFCLYCRDLQCDHEGHVWVEATCITSKRCIHCEATEGSALGHSYFDGVCSVCNCPDGIEYIISNGEVTITKYTGSATMVVIPETIEGYPVTTIGGYNPNITFGDPYSAFSNCDNLTSVTIPNTVTTIGSCAFNDCDGLVKIILPDSLTTIEYSAFNSCENLLRITIPDGVTSIGDEAFRGCSGLSRLTIGNGVTSIGNGAFAYCIGLTSVTIPGSVTTMGNSIFYECRGLARVTIEEGVPYIADYMFNYCTSLETIVIPDSVTSIGYCAFANCDKLTSITIPDSVTSIGHSAFYDCDGLTSITIPDSVTSMGTYAFYYCSRLSSVTLGSGLRTLSSYTFEDCGSLTNVNLGSGLETISDYAFQNCYNLRNIEIPDNVTSIGYRAFYSCDYLTNVTIGSGLEAIGNEVFYQCYNLSNVTIGSNVATIGNRAFAECSALTAITIPSSVTTIGDLAFTKTGLATIVIPDTVTTLGWDVFRGCTSLTTVTIGSGISALDVGTFTGCTNLTTVTLPATITAIGEEAFDGCQRLATVYFAGTQDQWDAVTIEAYNDPLLSARIICLDGCEHIWQDATCTDPQICTLCGDTQGAPNGHDYVDGICSVCQQNVDDLRPSAVISLMADKETLYRGDTVTLTVTTSPIEHSTYGGFLFEFDADIFEYVSGETTITGFTMAGVTNTNGVVAGYFMNGDETIKGTIFQVTLRVKDDAPFDSYSISGIANIKVNVEGTELSADSSVTGTSVSVACNHSYGEWIPLNDAQHKHICTICSHEEIAYIEYTVTFQYADGTIISSEKYHYGDAIVEPEAPSAPEANFAFAGWNGTVGICTGNLTYTAVFVKYIPGDINGDDAVDSSDAIYLLLATLFGEGSYPLGDAQCDIDCNGKVDHNDAIYLLLHTLFGAQFYPLNAPPVQKH